MLFQRSPETAPVLTALQFPHWPPPSLPVSQRLLHRLPSLLRALQDSPQGLLAPYLPFVSQSSCTAFGATAGTRLDAASSKQVTGRKDVKPAMPWVSNPSPPLPFPLFQSVSMHARTLVIADGALVTNLLSTMCAGAYEHPLHRFNTCIL